jgi:hypothetical protein
MATIQDQPLYIPNDIYLISQTDKVEGAAPGASFSGYGVSNWPIVQLTFRTAYLYQNQQTNQQNIAQLQGEVASLLSRNTWSNLAWWVQPGNYTWTVPSGISLIWVEVVGGGGGGCGVYPEIAPGLPAAFIGGGGGGAGGYLKGFLPVSGGQNFTLTVGAGGAGGMFGNPGGAGGASIFGPLTANGGGGAYYVSAGGGGIGGSGGSFEVQGSPPIMGFGGADGSDGSLNGMIFAGNGADGPFGGGGKANSQFLGNGNPGKAPGAGGGGVYGNSIAGGFNTGGPGAPGTIIIRW